MRMPNDTRLAESVDGIDIILGGHDHHYEVKKVQSVHRILQVYSKKCTKKLGSSGSRL